MKSCFAALLLPASTGRPPSLPHDTRTPVRSWPFYRAHVLCCQRSDGVRTCMIAIPVGQHPPTSIIRQPTPRAGTGAAPWSALYSCSTSYVPSGTLVLLSIRRSRVVLRAAMNPAANAPKRLDHTIPAARARVSRPGAYYCICQRVLKSG